MWKPTRIAHTSATCIDLFITNRPNLILDIKVSPSFCSDHCPVSIDINIKTSKEQCYKRTIRKYDQADYNSKARIGVFSLKIKLSMRTTLISFLF